MQLLSSSGHLECSSRRVAGTQILWRDCVRGLYTHILQGSSSGDRRLVLVTRVNLLASLETGKAYESWGGHLMAEELSLKPMTELLGLAFRVAFTICISVSGAGWPSRTSWAPKNQCRLHKASTFQLQPSHV